MNSLKTKALNPHNSLLIVLIAFVVVAGVAIDGKAVISTFKKTSSQQTTTKISPTSVPAPTDAMMSGWKTYTNKRYGYSIDAPSSWFAESFEYTNPSQLY